MKSRKERTKAVDYDIMLDELLKMSQVLPTSTYISRGKKKYNLMGFHLD